MPGNRHMRSARATSPGQLLDSADAPVTDDDSAGQPQFADGELAALAAQYGLRPSAQRPTLGKYLRELARRWNFIMGFATARNIAMYTEAKLGQLWQILAPLLNAGVYFLIFGLIITGVSRGVPNYLAFLVAGVFVFSFTQRTFISTSKVITDSLPLIRALQFPRAALPLAYVMIELQQMLMSMIVLVVIVLATGEPLTPYWLLALPALLLLTMFNAGIALFAARIGARVNDFAQLLPFLMRTWLYLSGVLYSIQQLVAQHAQNYGWATTLLQANPAAVYITLMRDSLLTSQRTSAFGYQRYNLDKCTKWLDVAKGITQHPSMDNFANTGAGRAAFAAAEKSYSSKLYYSAYCHPTFISAHLWEFGIGWAVVALLLGFWFFWRKEVFYGRG
jgi:teichoic acid transport system permease protein